MVEAAHVEEDSILVEIVTAIRHSFVYGIGSFLGKVFVLLLLPLYTHYLSPRDYGVFEVLELSMSLLGMFLGMGVTAALLRGSTALPLKRKRKNARWSGRSFCSPSCRIGGGASGDDSCGPAGYRHACSAWACRPSICSCRSSAF